MLKGVFLHRKHLCNWSTSNR